MIERAVEQVFVDMLTTAFPAIPVRHSLEDDSDQISLPCFIVSATITSVIELRSEMYALAVSLSYVSRPDVETEATIISAVTALDAILKAPVAPSDMSAFSTFHYQGTNKAQESFNDGRRSSIRDLNVTVQYS